MQIRKTSALRGPNIWAHFPVIEARVDLRDEAGVLSAPTPGLVDRLRAALPGGRETAANLRRDSMTATAWRTCCVI